MKKLYYLPLILMLFMLMGCNPAMFNIKPETPRQVYTTIEYQLIGAVQTASSLRERQVLDDENHSKLVILFDRAESIMDSTNLLLKQGEGEGTEANLRLVNSLLWEIRDILMEVENGS